MPGLTADGDARDWGEQHILEHLYRVFYGDLSICGCSSPGAAWVLLHELLKLAPLHKDGHSREALRLIGSDGAHQFVLSALSEAGLLEHGSSLGGSWLTDKGRWVLWAIGQLGGAGDLDERFDAVGYPHGRGEECTDACWRIADEGVSTVRST